MRIAQVAALFSDTGVYGGPLTVAMGQCQELASRGHDVTLYAGGEHLHKPPGFGAFEIKLFAVHKIGRRPGVANLFSPGLLREARGNIRDYDVVHVHLGRDLITLGTSLARGRRPLIVQTHGMIMPDRRISTRIVDSLLTRRLLSRAYSVLFLTSDEENGLRSVARSPAENLTRLSNGMPVLPISSHRSLNPVPRFFYCARLHERKNPVAFVDAAKHLYAEGFAASFRIAGPDEGELPRLGPLIAQAADVGVDIAYLGPIKSDEVARQMSISDVYVLPSRNEPFPMTVIEALSAGTPVIVSPTCGLAPLIARRSCGVVSESDSPRLAASMSSIVNDPAMWAERSVSARISVAEELSIEGVVDDLEKLYLAAAGRSSGSSRE